MPVTEFSFVAYQINKKRSSVTFTYKVTFKHGFFKTFTDKFYFSDILPTDWDKIPPQTLARTLESLHIIAGINYWTVFPTKNISLPQYALTQQQATFWNEVYTLGLAEYFYLLNIDFRDLIAFPFTQATTAAAPIQTKIANTPGRTLVLNGAGKDSILSAELLKERGVAYDYFTFSPSPAHQRVAKLAGVNMMMVTRKRDPWIIALTSSNSYPSVTLFTFVALLLAQLRDYDTIVFSNEKSADIGNFEYLGVLVNHQWCKSSDSERLVNDFIRSYITQDIKTYSLLRSFSELEIVEKFVQHKKYLPQVTSCNAYFWLPTIEQRMRKSSYWCRRCPKCTFLFACFSAYLTKKELVDMFGGNLYESKRLIPLFKRILGVEGTKPLDCVGEPAEMIMAMHFAESRKEYDNTPVMKMFKEHFPETYDFDSLKPLVFNES